MTTTPPSAPQLRRRRLVIAAAAAGALAPWPMRRALAHASFGPVAPRQPLPRIAVTTTDGERTGLARLLNRRITAMQLMFTGCAATCPIQGALFADTQAHLAGSDKTLQLLSISIDPLGDDARSLSAWLARFDAQPSRWRAAVAHRDDVDRLLDFLRGRAGGIDRHTTHVYLFDADARLAFRTAEMPAGAELAGLMKQLASLP